MANKVAETLKSAIAIAPFKIEKERLELAVDEINRLQDIVDKLTGVLEDSSSDPMIIYNGDPWHADETADTIRFHCGAMQMFKIPKRGTLFEEYWPEPELIKHLLTVLNSSK